jgi:hypothetical protein
MNAIELVPAGSSTSPIRPSLPRIKSPQSRPALAVSHCLGGSSHFLPKQIRERPGIAANPRPGPASRESDPSSHSRFNRAPATTEGEPCLSDCSQCKRPARC